MMRRVLVSGAVVLALQVATLAAPLRAAAVTAVAPFDLNGDGHPELVVGAPTANIGTVTGAGTVDMAFGSAGGPVLSRHSVLSRAIAGVPRGAAQGEGFGAALASGDLNGDGYADLVVGAPGSVVDGLERAGTVTVLYGSAAGVSTSAHAPLLLSPGVAGLPAVPDERGLFGAALAVGDLTGDGYADLVAGLPGARAVLLFTGSARGVSGARVQVVRPRALDPESEDIIVGFGAHVSVGDTNADGRADLVVGDQLSGEESSGPEVEVFRGTATGVGVTPLVVSGPPNGSIGAVAAGDLNGDGRADLVFRAGQDDELGGGISVALATATGFAAVSNYSQQTPGVPGADEANDDWGDTLAVARVDGDRFADVVVGAPGESIGSVAGAGAVTVLFGSSTGVSGLRGQSFSQDSPGVPGAAEPDDAFGSSLALTDLDGDARSDLVVGTPGENDTDGSVTVLQGSAHGVSTAGATTFGAGRLAAPATSSRFGYAVG